MVYKIIAKVLVNILKVILPMVISETQSSFVPGCMITNNIMVALETVDVIRRWKKGCISIKLDISKAYDRVEWSFLETLLMKMGFASHFIRLLMACITSVSYKVLINGVPTDSIQPTCSLW